MICHETLARAVEATNPLFVRFLAGFDDSNATAQSEHLPNHPAWACGHCALTMHRCAERFLEDGLPLPEADFLTGSGREGTAERFDTESICFGSKPEDDSTLYPPIERGVEVFEAACARLAAAIRNSPEGQLEKSIPWHDGEMPLWLLIFRICFHNATHAGQVVDLRRALGMKPVIGG